MINYGLNISENSGILSSGEFEHHDDSYVALIILAWRCALDHFEERFLSKTGIQKGEAK